ncbi:MAG: hypothetical protein ACRDTR_06045 [Rubrobacter sp.]
MSANDENRAYDLDAVIADVSADTTLMDPTVLPLVEPPPSAGPVFADFVLPDRVVERASDLRDIGEMAEAEEWIEGLRGRPIADQVGAAFVRVDEHSEGLGERRRDLVSRWARETSEERRTYRAVVVLAGWEDGPAGAQLVERACYDWLFVVRANGAHARLADLEIMGLNPGTAAPRERQLWEHAGTQLLLPFFHSFALLGCENSRIDATQTLGNRGPLYLRPAILPLWWAEGPGGDEPGRWEPGEPTLRPGRGRFSWLDGADPLPEGMEPGLYWIEIQS